MSQSIYVITPELSFYGVENKRLPKMTAFCIKEWIGVEPTNDGFADQSLTAWVPLRWFVQYIKNGLGCQPSLSMVKYYCH